MRETIITLFVSSLQSFLTVISYAVTYVDEIRVKGILTEI